MLHRNVDLILCILRLKALDNTAQGKAKRRPGLIKQNYFWRRENTLKKGSMLNFAAIVIQLINNNIQQSLLRPQTTANSQDKF